MDDVGQGPRIEEGSRPSEGILVSVCVPAYNHDRFIAKTLDSVLANDLPAVEIVIIDDGSTDGTASVVQEWIGRHEHEVSVSFHRRSNRGIASTLNELVDRARGAFIAPLASDDILCPTSLRERLQYLQANPEKRAVFSDCVVLSEEGRVLHRSGIRELHGGRVERYGTDLGLRREIIQNWAIPGGSLMVRRELHDELRYNEKLAVEDRDLYLRMVARNWLGYLDRPLTGYRLHQANVSLEPRRRMQMSRDAVRAMLANVWAFRPTDRLLFVRPILLRSLGLVFWTIRHLLVFSILRPKKGVSDSAVE